MEDQKFGIASFKSFLDSLESMNVVSDKTARNLRDSSLRLLTALVPDGEDITDVRTINIDDLASGYLLTSDDNVTDKSVATYKTRMKSAISKFVAHANGELKPNIRRSKISSLRMKNVEYDDVELIKTFDIPVPLRGDLIITLTNIPRDLSQEEADRIGKIVNSFAVKPRTDG